MTRFARFVCFACALAVVLFAAGAANAHALGLSRGEYRATEAGLDVQIVFAGREIAGALVETDTDRDGLIDAGELYAALALIRSEIPRLIAISAGDVPCAPELVETSLTERDGLRLRARYACTSAGAIHVVWNVLDRLPHGHRHVARVVSGGTDSERVCFASQRSFEVPRARAAAAPESSAGDWLRLGVHHIVTGYDHLVFLFALVLVASDVLSLIRVISCFTLAHSLSLGAAVLGFVAPPEFLVEPAIALSIAYIGIENLFTKRWKSRAASVFGFGLVHGLGFAGALSAVELPKAELPFALLLFNAGVELGQVAIVAAVFPLVRSLAGRPWFAARLVPACSAVVVVLGLGWFLARVTGD